MRRYSREAKGSAPSIHQILSSQNLFHSSDYPCSKRGHGLWNKIGCTSFQSLTRLRVTRLWHIKSPILKSGVVPIDTELLPVQSMAILSGNHTCHACNGHISRLSHRYLDNYSGTLFGSLSTSIVPSIWRNRKACRRWVPASWRIIRHSLYHLAIVTWGIHRRFCLRNKKYE